MKKKCVMTEVKWSGIRITDREEYATGYAKEIIYGLKGAAFVIPSRLKSQVLQFQANIYKIIGNKLRDICMLMHKCYLECRWYWQTTVLWKPRKNNEYEVLMNFAVEKILEKENIVKTIKGQR